MPLSPNMNLPLSVAGASTGLEWETNLNASLSILDQHNHTAGQGVTIPPSGLNINADLPYNGNNATTLRSTRYTPQVAALSLPSDLGCVYVAGVDLWFNDVNGNQVQLTTGGTVNATSSGISSGTATASFVSSVLVVNAASNTPANIRGGSILLGNNTVASNYLTLSPPNAMAANYGLVLPALPGTTNIMALDPSGNMSAPYSVDNSSIEIVANTIQVKDGGITYPKLSALNYQISANSGNQSLSNNSSFTNVPNLSVTITTSGRPVRLELISLGTGNPTSGTFQSTGTSGNASFFVNAAFYNVTTATLFGVMYLGGNFAPPTPPSSGTNPMPIGGVCAYDFPSAGTYTYTFQIQLTATTTFSLSIRQLALMAYEL